MDRRRLAAAALLVLPLAGCAQAAETASTVQDCAGLASDVARSGLSSVPTRAQAEDAVRRLDERVETLDSPEVRDAATDLRDRLRELQEAARSADPAAAQQAATRARAAAEATADACGIPLSSFLG